MNCSSNIAYKIHSLYFINQCSYFLRTFKRYEYALKELSGLDSTHSAAWLRTLLFPTSKRKPKTLKKLVKPISWVNESLNEPQKEAINFAIRSNPWDISDLYHFLRSRHCVNSWVTKLFFLYFRFQQKRKIHTNFPTM